MRAVLNSKGNHDFGSSNFLQTILARALATGLYERHLATIAAAYRRKRDAMIQALDRFVSTSARYQQPHGGLYIWLELEAGTKTGTRSKLFRRALDAGVLYVPGEMCFCNDPTRPIPQNCIRLSFGAPGRRANTQRNQAARRQHLIAGMKFVWIIVTAGLLVACGQSNTSRVPQREWTPLHAAADAGDVNAIDRIAKRRPDLINAPEVGDHTPLHVAVASGKREAVEHLLQDGANLEARDVCRWTPLHMAVDNNRKEIVEFLLLRGADINAKDCHGQTPLALALKEHRDDIARVLRQHGASRIGKKTGQTQGLPRLVSKNEFRLRFAGDGIDIDAAAVLVEAHFAFGQREERPIATNSHVAAGEKSGPALADDDAAGGDEFATVRFYAEPFADAVASVA